MATIKLGGNNIETSGTLPKVGDTAPDFNLTAQDLSSKKLSDFKGSRVIMNIFPSIDTNVCATSVRKFNEKATGLKNTKVLCISKDLPFAQKRFVSDEEINNVTNLSDFRDGNFGKNYGVEMTSGALRGLHSRAVLVLDENGKVIHSQQVPEIGEEPDYLSALKPLL
ncbi:MAG: lipid hydroperoxide peroxidase [Aequorivita sp.]|jgi:thiol peroxidase|nr:lipid hydroperoxide peroxidase [Aequorivita sp.]MBF30523.1 lipid hydroperoxide peroxidase [Aequorivita sp.]MDX1783697.1 thiol peroxidase [Aequorivita vladivostokensis]HBL79989.1 thiol peroxidase [Aequorivita sp.]|tara:strand:- start:15547 stop:16047 length:501 start_codon:yes stop_codon:yes gene_type:complete